MNKGVKSMRKNIFRILMLTVFLVMVSIGMVLLSASSSGSDGINGFEVENEITVKAGECVDIPIPTVFDSDGNILDVYCEVTDSRGGYVEITGNRFFATDGNGYLITYTVIPSAEKTVSKQTEVSVIGSVAVSISANRVVEEGEIYSINAKSIFTVPEFVYSVKHDGEEIEVSANGEFLCEESGVYEVSVTATETGENEDKQKSETCIFEVYAREPSDYAEIEVFNDNWSYFRSLDWFGLHDWVLTDSSQAGILDRNGLESDFIKTSVTAGYRYAEIWLNPRYDVEYYKTLVEQGYEYISIWVYSTGENTHSVSRVMDPGEQMYVVTMGDSVSYGWNEIRFPLADGIQDWTRSFITSFPYYENSRIPMLRINNLGAVAEEFDIYLSDVYAVRKSEVTPITTSEFRFDVGENISFSDFIDNPNHEPLKYYLQEADSAVEVSDQYAFTANGQYLLTVVPVAPDSYLDQPCEFMLTVEDDCSLFLTGNTDIQRDFGSSIEIDTASLGVSISRGAEEVPIIGVEVSFNGQNIALEDGKFITETDGIYEIVFYGDYILGGKTFRTYQTVEITVYSTIINESVQLIDTTDLTSIDLLGEQVMSSEHAQMIAEYSEESAVTYKLTDVFGEETSFEISEIDLNAISCRYYILTIDSLENTLYRGYIDLYRSIDGLVWNNDYIATQAAYFINDANISRDELIETVSLSEGNALGGRTEGSYFKITPAEHFNQNHIFQLIPIHSKEYYERFAQQGYSLNFDVYFEIINEDDGPFSSTNKIFMDNDEAFADAQNTVSVNTWTTLNDTLDRLLENWKQFFNPTLADSTAYRNLGILAYYGSGFDTDAHISFYIGNFGASV